MGYLSIWMNKLFRRRCLFLKERRLQPSVALSCVVRN